MSPIDAIHEAAAHATELQRDLHQIRLDQDTMVLFLAEIATDIHALVGALTKTEIVGITVTPGIPTRKESTMAKPTIKLMKKSAQKQMASAPKKATGPVTDFVLFNNENDTVTLQGIDSQGNLLDITGVATASTTSSDTSILTITDPAANPYAFVTTGKLSTPGTPVNLVSVVTWKDGSVGPFTVTLPVDVTANPSGAVGVVATPGTPTVR